MLKIAAKKPFNSSVFTSRELKILKELVEVFRDVKADQIIKCSHLPESPWDITFNKLKKRNGLIDYKLALLNPDSISPAQAEEIRDDRISIAEAFKNA
jgi:hypothetical protein